MIRFSPLDRKITSKDAFVRDDILETEADKYISLGFNGRLVNELGKELLKAASEGDCDEIKKLLNEGAPFTADWLGTSPIHFAAQGNHYDVCEILLRAGISSNARTKVDRTPLHMAAYEGHLSIVELFLREEAEIDCTDLLGMTPLHWAVQNGHEDVASVLLREGADKHVINKFGLKPIDIAHQIGRLDIVEIIEQELHEDLLTATEHLETEMATEDIQNGLEQENETIEINDMAEHLEDESHHLSDDCEVDNSSLKENSQIDCTLSDPMKLLQEHGITMLPNDDDNNILSTVMESGHSVVLTDVGKQVLASVKASEKVNENITRNLEKKNFITVTSDQFLTWAKNATINKNQVSLKRHLDGKFTPKTLKTVVMKKNKLQPISLGSVAGFSNFLKQNHMNTNKSKNLVKEKVSSLIPETPSEDIEEIKKELIEARKTIEEYKEKLSQKEMEVEKYKQQLNLLFGYS